MKYSNTCNGAFALTPVGSLTLFGDKGCGCGYVYIPPHKRWSMVKSRDSRVTLRSRHVLHLPCRQLSSLDAKLCNPQSVIHKLLLRTVSDLCFAVFSAPWSRSTGPGVVEVEVVVIVNSGGSSSSSSRERWADSTFNLNPPWKSWVQGGHLVSPEEGRGYIIHIQFWSFDFMKQS